jgi:hypothetical protein
MPERGETWLQAPVDPVVKHRVKVFAAELDLTLRQALEQLVIMGLKAHREKLDMARLMGDDNAQIG